MVDKLRCQQILINLLQNAIKYSNKNQKVVVSLEKRGEKHDPKNGLKHQFAIIVSDSGPGINEEDKDNLFKPYLNLKANMTRLKILKAMG